MIRKSIAFSISATIGATVGTIIGVIIGTATALNAAQKAANTYNFTNVTPPQDVEDIPSPVDLTSEPN